MQASVGAALPFIINPHFTIYAYNAPAYLWLIPSNQGDDAVANVSRARRACFAVMRCSGMTSQHFTRP